MNHLAYMFLISIITGIHCYGSIAQHSLRPRRCNYNESATVGKGVSDIGENALDFFVFNLQIGEGGMTSWAPVDEPSVAIDESLFIESYKDLSYGSREPLVKGKPLPRPITGGP